MRLSLLPLVIFVTFLLQTLFSAEVSFDIGGRSHTSGERTFPGLFGAAPSTSATATVTDTVNGQVFQAIFQATASSSDSNPIITYRSNGSNQTFLRVGSDSGDDAMESILHDKVTLTLLSIDNPLVTFSGFTRIAFGNAAPEELCDINNHGNTPALATGVDLTPQPYHTPSFLDVRATSGIFDIGEITLRFADQSTPDVTPPPTPSGFTGTPSHAAIELSWDQEPTPDLATHRLYRRLGGTGNFELHETISRTNTSFTDSGLTNGVVHEYQLSSVDVYGNESPRSDALSITPDNDLSPPATPTGLIATSGNGVTTLAWADNIEPDFSHYLVYRQTDHSGFDLIGNTPSPTFVDTGLHSNIVV